MLLYAAAAAAPLPGGGAAGGAAASAGGSILQDLLSNYVFVVGFCGWFSAQFLKIFTKRYKTGVSASAAVHVWFVVLCGCAVLVLRTLCC